MENIINTNNNTNNIGNGFSANIKSCPFCNMYLSFSEYQDHILCHEIDQAENKNLSNNINGYGFQNNNNKIQKESNSQDKSPEFLNIFKNKVNTLLNSIKKSNQNNDINNNINNNQNNSNDQNITNNINNIKESLNNINVKIKKNIKPVISKATDFFKNLVNSDSGSSSGDESPTIRLPTLRLRRSSPNRNRDNSLRDQEFEILNKLLNDSILNKEKEDENYKEILKYIPSSTINEPKNASDNNNKCVICLSEFQIGEKESTLPCLHIFHSNCIEKWITQKRWCPVCKYNLNLESMLSSNNY